MVCSPPPPSLSLSPSSIAHQHLLLLLRLHKTRLIGNATFVQAKPLLLSFDRPPPRIRVKRFSLASAPLDDQGTVEPDAEKSGMESGLPVGPAEKSMRNENANAFGHMEIAPEKQGKQNGKGIAGNGSKTVKGSTEGNGEEPVKADSGMETNQTGLSMEKEMRIGRLSFSQKDMKIAAGASLVVVFYLANRLLYKMALVPMKEYPFFLALFNTFGYVLVYFSILYVRYRAHIVTDEMLKLPKWRFVLVGFLEALGLASGMAAGAVLPGASLPILLQTFLIWQLIFSAIFLKRRYSPFQIIGCGLVFAGVILALTSTSNGMPFSTDQTQLFWPFVMILSSSFQAAASIIKEFVFRDAEKRLQGGSVDIFVVNSLGSGFQSLFVFLLLPFLSQVRGIPPNKLLRYASDGAGCLFNIGSYSAECNSATLLTFGYIGVNLAFNISLLSLLKNSSAVVTSLCTTLAVPLSIYMFTLPLPFVGTPSALPPQFLLGTIVLICGLAIYNFADRLRKQKVE